MALKILGFFPSITIPCLFLRESALEQADEEEEQKLLQIKTKQKERASQAIARSVVRSDTGTTVKQQKAKKVADETVNRRTVFVGNLPVDCTVQVCEWILSAKGRKRITGALCWRGCFCLGNHTCLRLVLLWGK